MYMGLCNVYGYSISKTVKLSDSYKVLIKLRNDNYVNDYAKLGMATPKDGGYMELFECVNVELPFYKFTEETVAWGNNKEAVYIPDYESLEDLKITLLEHYTNDNYKNKIENSTYNNSLKISQLVDLFLNKLLNMSTFSYIMNNFIPELKIVIASNDFNYIVTEYVFTNLKLSDYSSYDLDYSSSSPTKWELSFAYEGYSIYYYTNYKDPFETEEETAPAANKEEPKPSESKAPMANSNLICQNNPKAIASAFHYGLIDAGKKGWKKTMQEMGYDKATIDDVEKIIKSKDSKKYYSREETRTMLNNAQSANNQTDNKPAESPLEGANPPKSRADELAQKVLNDEYKNRLTKKDGWTLAAKNDGYSKEEIAAARIIVTDTINANKASATAANPAPATPTESTAPAEPAATTAPAESTAPAEPTATPATEPSAETAPAPNPAPAEPVKTETPAPEPTSEPASELPNKPAETPAKKPLEEKDGVCIDNPAPAPAEIKFDFAPSFGLTSTTEPTGTVESTTETPVTTTAAPAPTAEPSSAPAEPIAETPKTEPKQETPKETPTTEPVAEAPKETPEPKQETPKETPKTEPKQETPKSEPAKSNASSVNLENIDMSNYSIGKYETKVGSLGGATFTFADGTKLTGNIGENKLNYFRMSDDLKNKFHAYMDKVLEQNPDITASGLDNAANVWGNANNVDMSTGFTEKWKGQYTSTAGGVSTVTRLRSNKK